MIELNSNGWEAREFALSVVGDKVVGAQTSREALEAAGLADWNVRKVPAVAVVDGQQVTVPGKFVAVRDVHGETITHRGLGIVGSRYTHTQNETSFGFLDDLLDMAGEAIPFEYAGQWDGGRKVFVGLKLPKTITVGGFDDVETRLLLTNTHDGTQPFTLSLHVNRIACTNAIELAKRNAKAAQQHWTMRHTKSIDGRIQQARETLQLTFAAVDEFEREAQELIAKSITDRQFERLVEGVFPNEPGATAKARNANAETRLRVRSIYRGESGTQEQLKGTAWGAVNAFVEYADWHREVRIPKAQRATVDTRTARALAQVDSRHVARFKSDVMGRVLAMR